MANQSYVRAVRARGISNWIAPDLQLISKPSGRITDYPTWEDGLDLSVVHGLVELLKVSIPPQHLRIHKTVGESPRLKFWTLAAKGTTTTLSLPVALRKYANHIFFFWETGDRSFLLKLSVKELVIYLPLMYCEKEESEEDFEHLSTKLKHVNQNLL